MQCRRGEHPETFFRTDEFGIVGGCVVVRSGTHKTPPDVSVPMTDADTTEDVVVIGGGVVGASCAWHLLENGVEDVLIVEKDRPASKASGRAAGHLSTYTSLKHDPAVHEYCIDVHRSLADRHDEIDLRGDVDHVLAHTERGADRLAEFRDLDPDRASLLDGEELAERGTPFATDGVTAALVVDDAVHTDPYALTTSLVAEAQSRGATLALAEVAGITDEGDGLVVSTTEGDYAAPTVVDAAGAWSGRVASMVGVDLPVRARTSQIVVLEPTEPVDVPMFHCPDIGLYGRQETSGEVLVGGGSSEGVPDPDDFSTVARETFVQYVSESAPRIAPAVADAGLVNDWAGRCTATPDRKPLIGPTPVEGFYVCAGFNGSGVARSPFAGRLLAEHVTGRAPSFPADPYDPRRFEGNEEFELKSNSTDW